MSKNRLNIKLLLHEEQNLQNYILINIDRQQFIKALLELHYTNTVPGHKSGASGVPGPLISNFISFILYKKIVR